MTNWIHAALPRVRRDLAAAAKPRALSPREGLMAFATTMAFAWLAFGSYALQGGIFSDQWDELATQRFIRSGDLGARLASCVNGDAITSLPGACLIQNIAYAAFGEHGKLYAATALIGFGVILGLFYVVLRATRVAPLWAAGAVALVATFQGADSLRLWPMLAAEGMLISFLAGMLLAALAVRSTTTWRLWAFGAAATGLLMISSTFYQTIAGVTPVAIAYIWIVDRRVARAVIIGGAATIGAVIISYFRATSSGRIASRTIGGTLDHAAQVVRGTVDSWVDAFMRFPAPAWWAVGIILICAALGTVLAWHVDGCSQIVRSAWTMLALGAVVSLLGTASLIPTDDYYVPRPYGLDNRMLIVAQFGYALVAIGLFAFVGLIVAGILGRPEGAVGAAVTLVVISSVLGLNASFTSRDLWTQSWERQLHILDVINRTVPRVRPNEVIMTFGHSLYEPNWLPIFVQPWELDSAIKISRDNPTASGYPISGWTCVADGLSRVGPGGKPPAKAELTWDDLVFVNVALNGAEKPRGLRDCLHLQRDWGTNPTF